MNTMRTTCNCQHCAEYADRNGYAFPLAADVNTLMAGALGITEKNATRGKRWHEVVATAYDPMIRETVRRGTNTNGPWAVC